MSISKKDKKRKQYAYFGAKKRWNSGHSMTFIFSGTFPNIFNDFSIYNSKNAAQFKSMQTDTMLITRTKFYKLTRDQSHV